LRIGVYKLLSGELTNFFDGSIDEIRIWNYELSEEEINNRKNISLIGNETGLLAYYNMENSAIGDGVIMSSNATFTGESLNGLTYGTKKTPYFEPLLNSGN